MSDNNRKQIEIEIKIIFNERIKEILFRYLKSKIDVKIFTDSYYDDKSYSLTTKDIWLRQRNNKWELKIPRSLSYNINNKDNDNNSAISPTTPDIRIYKEVFNVNEIYDILYNLLNKNNNDINNSNNSNDDIQLEMKEDININNKLERLLDRFNIAAFSTFGTERESVIIEYENQEYRVDFDTTLDSYVLKDYRIAEIELMVDDSNKEVSIAKEKIDKLCKSLELTNEDKNVKLYGKILEFIKRSNPSHWNALLSAFKSSSKNTN